MDQHWQTDERPVETDDSDRRMQRRDAPVMRIEGNRRGGDAVPHRATAQELTFTANGLAG